MTAREALRTQLDALTTDLHALEAENRRLKEDRPEQAAALESERELVRTREENARLARELDQLKGLYEQLLQGTREAEAEATPMAKRCEALETEVGRLRNDLATESAAHAEQREIAHSLREELESVRSRAEELDERCKQLEFEYRQQLRDAELQRYRAVAEENRKWEAREARLVQRLEELEEKAAQREGAPVFTPASLSRQTEAVQAGADATVLSEGGGADENQGTDRPLSQSLMRQQSPQQSTLHVHFRSELSPSQRSPSTLPRGGSSNTDPSEGDSTTGLTQPKADPLSMAMLAQHLPPLPKFTGDSHVGSEEERFDEWLERLEMVADVCGWGEQAKLVNLITRLRGPAYSFYRSCTPQQRSSFQALSTALTERFTPVCLKSVQSSRFHDRKQQGSETVDSYAQELKKLFYRAYPTTQQGSMEAEAMGRTVLACQFVAGLRSEIKAKVAGMDGEFEQLVTKARFEEAKLRDLAEEAKERAPKKPFSPTTVTPSRGEGSKQQTRDRESASTRYLTKPAATTTARCFNCGIAGHLARNCRQRPRAPPEARGRFQGRNDDKVARIDVAGEAEGQATSPKGRVAELRRQLKEAEVEEAMNTVTATMKGITSPGDQGNALLGPTVTAEVVFEGMPVLALLDTGSPVTIVSLDFMLKALAARRPETQQPEEWKKDVRARLKAPTITLRSYGGGELDIVSQMKAQLSKGKHSLEGVVQVQKGAPVDLLIGTDLQPRLGFLFLESGPEDAATDLFDGKVWSVAKSSTQSVTRQLKEKPLPTEVPGGANTESPVVHLIQATRLPARHSKLVRARADCPREKSFTLFEPAKEILKWKGLLMEDGAAEPDKDGYLTLAIQNRSLEPVCLEEGQVLGELQQATLLDTSTKEASGGGSEVKIIRTHSVQEKTPEETTTIPAVVEQSLEDLPATESAQLRELLTKYSDLFVQNDLELGSTDVVTHSINTGDHPPIRQLPRRIPFALRGKVEEMVGKMLRQGVVRPSKSPWASPIVLVAKKDGSTRFCVDYRRLNAITKMDVFPLPRIDDSLDLLSKTKYFTTLDLASGYWQVAMDEESREKTAFVTHSGLYEFLVMPFGLCNAPATFQRLMETVLADLIRDKCIVYIDDILVMGETLEDHLQNLEKVLQRLREAGLKLKPAKCHFLQRGVEYLGHVVSKDGISPDPRKVEAVRNFPVPNNLKTLRSFLGLASYYRRFIKGFSAVASPLFALTRKDTPYMWTRPCEEAFEKLKELMTGAPLLAYPDFSRGFLLETDASGEGLGAVLAQKLDDGSIHPIAYASRTLQPHERNYGVTELEALGVVWAIKHFRPYLYGHRCEVFTDHEALRSLLNTPQPSGKLARWGMVIQELDLEIRYRPGKHNANADALSRAPVGEASTSTPSGIVAAITEDQVPAKDGEPKSSLADRQRVDPKLKPVMEYLTLGVLPSDEVEARNIILNKSNYTLIDGVLFHLEPDKTLRIVPPVADREKLFQEAHSGVFGGHLRDAKVHSQLARHYWWPGMRVDIVRWNRGCLTCATRRLGRPIKPPLTPIPVGGPFDRVGVDVIHFPRSYLGNQYAVVFVDYLTKWPEVFPTQDQTALTIARLLVEHVIPRHGVPSELLSDRGAAFLSCLMKEVCELMGIHQVNTTAYHPQTDGLVERFNRTMTDMLAKTVDKSGRDWDVRLPYVLFAYRTSMQESTRESPFYLLYGRDPQLPTEAALTVPQSRELMDVDSYKTELVCSLADAWKLAQDNVKKAQKRQKTSYDRSARLPKFTVGDRVFLYMPAAKSTKAYKFAKPFRGPYRIVKLYENGAELLSVEHPKAAPIRVAMNRLRSCPVELMGVAEPLTSGTDEGLSSTKKSVNSSDAPADQSKESEKSADVPGVWANRLRSWKNPVRDDSAKDGDM